MAVLRRSDCCLSCRSQLTVSGRSSLLPLLLVVVVVSMGSAEEVIILRIVRGTKLTIRPSSLPSWRAMSAERGVWFVASAAEIHSVRR